MQVHVDRGGERYGPYSLEDVNAYLTNGTLLPTDQAWQDGMPDWVPITQIPGVTMPGGAAAPPAPAAGAACPQCQAPVDATQVICMGCGTRLQGETAAAKGGSKKALFISLGVAGVIGLAVGSYFLFFNKEAEVKQAKENTAIDANTPAGLLKKIYSLAQKEDYEKLNGCIFAFSDQSLPDMLLQRIKDKKTRGGDGAYSHKALKTLIDNHLGELKPAADEALEMCLPGGDFGEDKRVAEIAEKNPEDITMFDFKGIHIVIIKHEGEHKLLFWENLTKLGGDEFAHQAASNHSHEGGRPHPPGEEGRESGSGGFQPIHQAAEEGDLEAIKQHLRAGQNINLQMGKDGETPLHRAITRGQVEAVRLLINNGANVNIGRRKDGKTPLDLAVSRGEASIAKLLRGKGATATGDGRPGGGFAGGFPGGQGGGKTRPGGSGGGGFSLERFDRDKDGRIGKSEVPQFMARMFDQLDSNKDGFIDQVEINAMRQNFPQGEGRPSGGGFQGGKTRPGGFGGKGGGQTRPGGFGGGQRPGGGFGGKALPGKEEGGTGQCPYCKKIFPAPNLPFHVRKCPKNSGDQIRPGGFGGRPRPRGQGGGKAPEGVIGGQSGLGGIISQPR